MSDYHFRDHLGKGIAPLADIKAAITDGVLSAQTLVSLDGDNWTSPAIAAERQVARSWIAGPPPIPYSPTPAPLPQVVYVVEKKKTSPVTWGVLVLIVLAVIAGITLKSMVPETYGDSSAYMAGQSFVKKNLKNPDGAKFDKLNSDDCFHFEREDGLFEVGGTVRSTNSFGAIVSTNWKCVVQHNGGGQFSLKYLKLGKQEDRPYPSDGASVASPSVTSSKPQTPNADQGAGHEFVGLTKEKLIAKMGQPIETKSGTNPQDGDFEILVYDDSKQNSTLFTIWKNDGYVSSGSLHGKFFFKK